MNICEHGTCEPALPGDPVGGGAHCVHEVPAGAAEADQLLHGVAAAEVEEVVRAEHSAGVTNNMLVPAYCSLHFGNDILLEQI